MPKYSQRSLIQHERETGVGSSMREAAKPTAEHRYPRGYTPERQTAVRSAMAKAPLEVSNTGNPLSGGNAYLSQTEFLKPSDTGIGGKFYEKPREAIRGEQAGQAYRAHVDAISRSTVPLEHLDRLPSIHVKPLESAAGMYTNPGLGNYLTGDPHAEKHGRITIDPAATPQSMEHTLIHELGHHLDYHADPTKFSQRAAAWVPLQHGGTASPHLEGYAEGYAQGHTRHRSGETPHLSYRELARDGRFSSRYEEASGGMKVGEHPDVKSPQHLSPQMAGQDHLYQRAADISETRTERDYGQFPLRDDDNNPLGTIKVGRGVPADVSAPGFKPGDSSIAATLRHGRGKYDLPKEQRQRVATAWNERYDEDRLYPD